MRPRFEADLSYVTRVEPEDGADGVFRDALVLARLSHPVDPDSLSDATFSVHDLAGAVPSRVDLSPDHRVVIWRPGRLLDPGVEHQVVAEGLRDRRGRPVAPHRSRFVPGPLAFRDLIE